MSLYFLGFINYGRNKKYLANIGLFPMTFSGMERYIILRVIGQKIQEYGNRLLCRMMKYNMRDGKDYN
jgi:hypothetical protein